MPKIKACFSRDKMPSFAADGCVGHPEPRFVCFHSDGDPSDVSEEPSVRSPQDAASPSPEQNLFRHFLSLRKCKARAHGVETRPALTSRRPPWALSPVKETGIGTCQSLCG